MFVMVKDKNILKMSDRRIYTFLSLVQHFPFKKKIKTTPLKYEILITF